MKYSDLTPNEKQFLQIVHDHELRPALEACLADVGLLDKFLSVIGTSTPSNCISYQASTNGGGVAPYPQTSAHLNG